MQRVRNIRRWQARRWDWTMKFATAGPAAQLPIDCSLGSSETTPNTHTHTEHEQHCASKSWKLPGRNGAGSPALGNRVKDKENPSYILYLYGMLEVCWHITLFFFFVKSIMSLIKLPDTDAKVAFRFLLVRWRRSNLSGATTRRRIWTWCGGELSRFSEANTKLKTFNAFGFFDQWKEF